MRSRVIKVVGVAEVLAILVRNEKQSHDDDGELPKRGKYRVVR